MFSSWQSPKTRSLKRFSLSLSFLLTISLIIGIDITKVKPLGINFSGADESVFLVSLIVIHSAAFIFYRIQRNIDIKVRQSRLSLTENQLAQLLDLYLKVEALRIEKGYSSFHQLVNSIKAGTTRLPEANRVFRALKFFKENLEKVQRNFHKC